jgi:2-methylcitrate dehydratase PrpD
MNQIETIMSTQPTESKKLLSYTIAEWACALKYEDLSLEAIQAAKLFWFDSIGCALGGSQQDDAKILLGARAASSIAKERKNSRSIAIFSSTRTVSTGNCPTFIVSMRAASAHT